MDKDWEHRELKSVKVMGLCKKIFSNFVIILFYNKHQKGDNRKIEKMPEARAQSMRGTNICLLQLFHRFYICLGTDVAAHSVWPFLS